MRSQDNGTELSVLLIEEEDGWWSAQCLEYDVAAQAKSLSELRYEFERVFITHLALSKMDNKQPFEGVGRAPEEYWKIFESAELEVSVEKRDDQPIPEAPMPSARFKVADRPAA